MERKSSAYLNSDDMFSTYAQKTYMENIPCELALTTIRRPFYFYFFIYLPEPKLTRPEVQRTRYFCVQRFAYVCIFIAFCHKVHDVKTIDP